MPFQRVPDTVEVVIEGEVFGEECVNTHYAQKDGGYVLADITALAADVDAWVAESWLPQMPSTYQYNQTVVRGLDAEIDLQATNDDNAGVGGLTASTKSNNASLAVARRSGLTGRGARGRIYLPPPSPDSMTDDNHVSAAFATAIEGALDALSTVVGDAGFVPVIVHRVAAGVPLTEAVVFTLLEWVVVDLVIDSMRRRLPKRGV